MRASETAWLQHQRQRWLRPNAERYLRADAARWMSSDLLQLFQPPPCERKYRPDQPCVPAGNPDGGQWTTEEGATAVGVTVADHGRSDPRIMSDATPDRGWVPGEQYAQRRSRDGSVIINGRRVALTAGQDAQLQAVQSRAENLTARVRELDPNWRPRRLQYETPQGLIQSYQDQASEAQSRLESLAKFGIGPGSYAQESIPARGLERDFTVSERRANNYNG